MAFIFYRQIVRFSGFVVVFYIRSHSFITIGLCRGWRRRSELDGVGGMVCGVFRCDICVFSEERRGEREVKVEAAPRLI